MFAPIKLTGRRAQSAKYRRRQRLLSRLREPTHNADAPFQLKHYLHLGCRCLLPLLLLASAAIWSRQQARSQSETRRAPAHWVLPTTSMANNNYPQPFGYPYAYPPPPPHADEAQMPPQHAPPQNPFHHNMPGLQPPALPGINFASHAQNNQQPPFPQGMSIIELCVMRVCATMI